MRGKIFTGEKNVNFEKLDRFIKAMPQRGIPACELSVTKDGKQLYRASVGFADEGRLASPSDLYWIFSATKVVTCVAAMQLVEKGVLHLDDPVSRYLPAYENMVRKEEGSLVPAKEKMTLLHLFTMTGGLTYDISSPSIKNATDKTTVGLAEAIAHEPLVFEPGSHYRYSLCHDVLAAVVEVASGMPFSRYLQENIFDPLGMKDIGFRPNEAQKRRFSAQYIMADAPRTATRVACANNYILSENYESGGAGLFSSVDDYMKMLTVLACGGKTEEGYVLLTPESIAMMGENRLAPEALNDFVTTRLYGYGWGLCGRAHMDPAVSLSPTAVGEFGWDGAAGAFALVDSTNRIAVYFGTHVCGFTYLYHKIHFKLLDLIYEGLEEK